MLRNEVMGFLEAILSNKEVEYKNNNEGCISFVFARIEEWNEIVECHIQAEENVIVIEAAINHQLDPLYKYGYLKYVNCLNDIYNKAIFRISGDMCFCTKVLIRNYDSLTLDEKHINDAVTTAGYSLVLLNEGIRRIETGAFDWKEALEITIDTIEMNAELGSQASINKYS